MLMKRFLLLMLLTVSYSAMQADQVQTLIVQLKDGSQTAFFLKDKPQVKRAKIGRNDPCPCGSGKKYKNCCGRN